MNNKVGSMEEFRLNGGMLNEQTMIAVGNGMLSEY